MSTVAEIEAAIEKLPAEEQRRLREWINRCDLSVPPARPKTGSELAASHSSRFHLQPAEADEFALELN